MNFIDSRQVLVVFVAGAALALIVLPLLRAAVRQRLGAHLDTRAAVRAAGAGPEHRGRLRRPARPGLRRVLRGRRLHVRAAGIAAPDRDTSTWIAAMFPNGLHMPLWLVIPLGAALAAALRRAARRADAEAARRLPGHRDARLRRNHPRLPEQPGRSRSTSPTARKGIDRSTRSTCSASTSARRIDDLSGFDDPVGHALLLPVPRARASLSVVICHRLELSRIGRAWMAIREDEIAAKAMGINTRNMKLLAFGMGATFGGVSGVDVRRVPGLRLARVVQPDGVA